MPVDRAILNTLKGLVRLIKGDNLDLTRLPGVLHGAQNCGAVIAPQSNKSFDIGILHYRVGCVRLRPDRIDIIGARVHNLDLRAHQHFLDALNTFLGVPGIQLPDEQHDLTACGEDLLDEFSSLPTGRDVIRPDVTCAIALRRIAILRKDQGLPRSVVDKGSLILRIDGEIAIPLMPPANRSSMIRFCSAAVPSDVILNSAVTSFNSASAFSTPFRAIVQKSAELLVTKANFSSFSNTYSLTSSK